MTRLSQNLIWIVLGGLVVAFLWHSQAIRPRGGEGAGMMHDAPDANSDPVTGNWVDPTHVTTANFEGRTFCFKSEQSRVVFQQNPPRFVR